MRAKPRCCACSARTSSVLTHQRCILKWILYTSERPPSKRLTLVGIETPDPSGRYPSFCLTLTLLVVLSNSYNEQHTIQHYVEVDAVVFMVDAMDRDRFEEAKEELNGVLSSDVFLHVPILVLGNKIDNPRAVDEHTLRKELGLLNTTTGKPNKALPKDHPSYIRPVELFMCSVVKKAGLKEAFEWIERNVDI
ncbi:GTP-binding protein SAR1b, variant 3 [Balamuthia mandrillaris]